MLITAYGELASERTSMTIPVGRIHEYLVRHRLPDYWEPVVLQLEVHRIMREDADDGGTS